MGSLCDVAVAVPSARTARVQEAHITIVTYGVRCRFTIVNNTLVHLNLTRGSLYILSLDALQFGSVGLRVATPTYLRRRL